MRHIASLAYLTPREIPAAFERLKRIILPKEAEEVTDWFFRYYVGGSFKIISKPNKRNLKLRQTRIPLLFPPCYVFSRNSNRKNFPEELKQLYKTPLNQLISVAKKRDLLQLCDKGVIPEELHPWLQGLQTDAAGKDRLPDCNASDVDLKSSE